MGNSNNKSSSKAIQINTNLYKEEINIFLLLKPRMSSCDIIKLENLFDIIELSGKRRMAKKI